MSLFETIGQNRPDYLLYDPQDANVVAIPCEPGNGIVKRGTVMYRKSSGFWAPAASANVSTSNQLAIINETVDTDANLAVAEDAAAYIAGRFVKGRVKLASDADLTAAHEVVLRLEGMTFEFMHEPGAAFDNGRYTITYKANNAASPAEDDYVDYKDPGATHTVLANSVTGFTPPSTKAFSKWNTKDDGSGTDYAAAASYTTDADLVLYAIYA